MFNPFKDSSSERPASKEFTVERNESLRAARPRDLPMIEKDCRQACEEFMVSRGLPGIEFELRLVNQILDKVGDIIETKYEILPKMRSGEVLPPWIEYSNETIQYGANVDAPHFPEQIQIYTGTALVRYVRSGDSWKQK